MPDGTWHPTALLRVVATGCAAGPFVIENWQYQTGFQQRVAVTSAAARLAEMGFPLDDLVRGVFGPTIQGEFLRFSARAAFDLARKRPVPEGYRWAGELILAEVKPPEEDSFFSWFQHFLQSPVTPQIAGRAGGWIATAELQHLLCWKTPSAEDWNLLPIQEVDPHPTCPAKWVVDRFLVTYLKDWSTFALHEEYRYSIGLVAPPIPVELMAMRSIETPRLEPEIARRAVIENDSGRYYGDLLQRAVQLLEAGQYEAAIALFHGALAVSSDDWVKNGLAFSLLPTDPAGALALWEELIGDDFDLQLSYANAAAAAYVLEQHELSRRYALASLQHQTDGRSAYLWDVTAPELRLHHVPLADYALALGAETRKSPVRQELPGMPDIQE